VLKYTSLDGLTYDLSQLPPEQIAFVARCRQASAEGLYWVKFMEMVQGAANPLVAATGGWVTRAVMQQPLYQAMRDLADRVGIAQGVLAPKPGDLVDIDPWTDERPSAAKATAAEA
jgi:hypothetical protein